MTNVDNITLAVWVHLATAVFCFGLGGIVLLLRKGTRSHILLGRTFVGVMVIVSLSALFIQTLNSGEFSVLHMLVPVTLGSLLHAMVKIRRYKTSRNPKDLKGHKYAMMGVYFGALVIAGSFALMSGRLLNTLLFGLS